MERRRLRLRLGNMEAAAATSTALGIHSAVTQKWTRLPRGSPQAAAQEITPEPRPNQRLPPHKAATSRFIMWWRKGRATLRSKSAMVKTHTEMTEAHWANDWTHEW